jgi:NDP-sugar pyrophosphorylase family protein
MILGAGLGSRLKPFTERFPKPLIPVLGVPSIEFSLLNLAHAGVKEGVVNVHAHADQMKSYLSSNPVSGISLTVSSEEKLLLGSAGGFRHALSHFKGEAFFSLNADVIHLAPLKRLEEAHKQFRHKHGIVMTLVLATGEMLKEQTGEYREINVDHQSGLVTGFGEKKKQVPFYTGSAIFECDAFSHLKDGVPAEFVPEVLEPMIQANKVAFIESDALWVDIGSPELWRKAIERLDLARTRNELPEFILERLRTADPTLGGRFELGKSHIRYDDIEYEA